MTLAKFLELSGFDENEATSVRCPVADCAANIADDCADRVRHFYRARRPHPERIAKALKAALAT